MNKKAIAILGAIFLLIVGTLGFLIYAKYGNKGSVTVTPTPNPIATTSPTQQATTTPTLPVASTTLPVIPPVAHGSSFTKLLDGPVTSPALFYNGQGVTYFDPIGQLYQVSTQIANGQLQPGSPQSLNIQTKANITSIVWPPSGDNFIAELGGVGQKSWSFYNSTTTMRGYIDLPSQVEALDWLPSGQQIYYIWLDGGKATLNVGDPDTKNWKYIADMWEKDDALSVSPDGKNIIYYEQNTATSTNPIYLTTPDGKIWKTLVSTGVNYGALWSPDSQKFLFAKKDTTGTFYQLWYYNLMTGEVTNLKLNTTVDKAVWSKDSQTVYAAVPTSGIAGSGNLTTDSFYKFNTGTGDKQQYNPGSQNFDGENLFLSNDEGLLFFKNAQDGGLYYLNLN